MADFFGNIYAKDSYYVKVDSYIGKNNTNANNTNGFFNDFQKLKTYYICVMKVLGTTYE